MILLSFLLLVAVPNAPLDPRDRPVKAEIEHVPVVDAHNRCLFQKLGTTRRVDAEFMTRALEYCRTSLRARMDSGEFGGISRRASSASRRKVESVLDGTDAQFSFAMTWQPSTELVDARARELGIGVTVYDPIAPQYDLYSGCVSKAQKEGRIGLNPKDRVKGWKRAIESCRALKSQLMAAADPILARQPDFRNLEKRRAAIAAMFDGHDQMVIKAAATDWLKPVRVPAPVPRDLDN